MIRSFFASFYEYFRNTEVTVRQHNSEKRISSLPLSLISWISVKETVVIFCLEETDEFGRDSVMRRLFVFGAVELASNKKITVKAVFDRQSFITELESAIHSRLGIGVHFWGDLEPSPSIWTCAYFASIDSSEAEKIRGHEKAKNPAPPEPQNTKEKRKKKR